MNLNKFVTVTWEHSEALIIISEFFLYLQLLEYRNTLGRWSIFYYFVQKTYVCVFVYVCVCTLQR